MDKRMAVNGREFTIVKLLGKGKGGYSYLAEDGAGEYVLKQIHHEPCDYYQFGNKMESEMRDYQKLDSLSIRMPKMLDADMEKERILKEYIKGDTIYGFVLHDRMDVSFIGQMHKMCEVLYAAHINIDYFPTNFIVRDGKIYYVDYECNSYSDKWNFENWGIRYWSKTPEFLQYVKEHPE